MKKIKNILVAVDGNYDKQALIAEVVAVTKDTNAQVTLLGILETPPDGHEKSSASSDLQQWMQEDQQEEIKAISSEFEKKGIQITIKHANGKPYLEIIREALRGNYELVMKPAVSEPALKTLLFGSTDMQLFRLCPCPVWAFKPTDNTELRKIMVAVDLLSGDQEKNALADKVLQWGKHIAGLVGSELHVVHIWNLYGEARLRSRSVVANTVDKLVKEEEQSQLKLLNEALAKNGLDQKDLQIHFHKGEASELIPDIVKIIKTDLLIMGTVGRTGVPGFFIGNTADSVLRQVSCSVLAVKPDGFITPVEL